MDYHILSLNKILLPIHWWHIAGDRMAYQLIDLLEAVYQINV